MRLVDDNGTVKVVCSAEMVAFLKGDDGLLVVGKPRRGAQSTCQTVVADCRSPIWDFV